MRQVPGKPAILRRTIAQSTRGHRRVPAFQIPWPRDMRVNEARSAKPRGTRGFDRRCVCHAGRAGCLHGCRSSRVRPRCGASCSRRESKAAQRAGPLVERGAGNSTVAENSGASVGALVPGSSGLDADGPIARWTQMASVWRHATRPESLSTVGPLGRDRGRGRRLSGNRLQEWLSVSTRRR